MKKTLLCILGIIILIAIWFGLTYNGLVTKQEQVESTWGNVQSAYQRRMDLIPNLVSTVKGYAKHEKSTLLEVTKARVQAYNASNKTSNSSPESQQQLNQLVSSQAALSGAVSKLLVVSERYPDLKSNENFLKLQDQLEGTENRINYSRDQFNNSVKTYNASIRRFPGNIVANIAGGFNAKPYFQAEKQAASAPKVTF